MQRSNSELLDIIKQYIGENTDDLSLSLLEDATDTLATDLDAEIDRLKSALETLDQSWRKRYRDRFDNTESVEEVEEVEEAEDGEKEITIDDLFEEE